MAIGLILGVEAEFQSSSGSADPDASAGERDKATN